MDELQAFVLTLDTTPPETEIVDDVLALFLQAGFTDVDSLYMASPDDILEGSSLSPATKAFVRRVVAAAQEDAAAKRQRVIGPLSPGPAVALGPGGWSVPLTESASFADRVRRTSSRMPRGCPGTFPRPEHGDSSHEEHVSEEFFPEDAGSTCDEPIDTILEGSEEELGPPCCEELFEEDEEEEAGCEEEEEEDNEEESILDVCDRADEEGGEEETD